MVVFMSIVFTTIALISTQALLGHTETYVQQAYGESWNRLLGGYYETHHSWDGVQGYVSKIIEDPRRKFVMIMESNSTARIMAERGMRFGRNHRDSPRFWVFDLDHNVVCDSHRMDFKKHLSQLPFDNKITKQWTEINVRNQTVGYYWQDNRLIANNAILAKTIETSIVQAMIIGLIVTSLLALLLGLLLTRHFTKPLNHLMEAVRNVGKGDLSSRVNVKGNGDIAVLARDFNWMTEQLTRNEEVRRNMVADIAHELRTPLSVILGKLESIQEGVLPSTPETILPIQDETLRLIRLVRDLQQLSLAEAGKLPMAFKPVDLRLLVERIMEQFTFEFEARGLTIEITGYVPEIIADPDRLTQVLVNLIGNALLHTPPGGSLRLILEEVIRPGEKGPLMAENKHRLLNVFRRTDQAKLNRQRVSHAEMGTNQFSSSGWVQVTVQDSGEGIPEDELEYIFNRFYRVDKARERESGGTGLGLAIAKEFIQAHGGSIQVESKAGEGSRFKILLPVQK